MPKAKEVDPAPPAPETTAKSTAKKKPGQFVPAHGGGKLNTGGTPGNKGGGRPPHAYKEWLEASLTHATAKAQVTKVLRNNNHPAYAAVLRSSQLHVLGVPGKAQEVPPDEDIHVSVDL